MAIQYNYFKKYTYNATGLADVIEIDPHKNLTFLIKASSDAVYTINGKIHQDGELTYIDGAVNISGNFWGSNVYGSAMTALQLDITNLGTSGEIIVDCVVK